jgi:plastocyanin
MVAVGTAALLWGCGGGSSSYSTSTPTTPTPTGGGAATVTVAIVADTGSSAFKPNPVSASNGDTIAFQNNGTTVHHIVLDDGSADFGNLNPGQTSAAKTIKASGNFHCTIHSSMVGAINGAVPEPPPCNTPGYC